MAHHKDGDPSLSPGDAEAYGAAGEPESLNAEEVPTSEWKGPTPEPDRALKEFGGLKTVTRNTSLRAHTQERLPSDRSQVGERETQ